MTYIGTIVKGIGGFYYVDTAEGYFECRARGNFRYDKIKPLVGDRVKIAVENSYKTGWVDEILPRKNVLLRPPTANVTQMALTVSTANPKPNLYLTDKVLCSAEIADINVIICINKTDIEAGDELFDIYKKAGYDVLRLSAKTGENTEELKEKLKDNITVFCGNSGVGKSSVLNRIIGKESFETGEVSQKVERGKHTTRHSELVKLASGGYIIDTPGFGSFDMSLLAPDDTENLFPEFALYLGKCRFADCKHIKEPGCAIREALEVGDIAKSRYESYVKLNEELENSVKR